MKQYITPQIKIYIPHSELFMVSDWKLDICNELCVLWHTCRDRCREMKCMDKKYK